MWEDNVSCGRHLQGQLPCLNAGLEFCSVCALIGVTVDVGHCLNVDMATNSQSAATLIAFLEEDWAAESCEH